jgi:hypothetical protein
LNTKFGLQKCEPFFYSAFKISVLRYFKDFHACHPRDVPEVTHSQPQTLSIVACLEPQVGNRGLGDPTIIPVAIVGRYVGLAWKSSLL